MDQIAQQPVMRLFTAQYTAATVEVHHHRQKTFGAFRAIDANGNLSTRTNRKDLVFNIGWQLSDFYGLRIFQHLTSVRVGELIERLSSLRIEGVNKSLSLGFEDWAFLTSHHSLLCM